MTPAEHLAEAERLLSEASDPEANVVLDRDWVLIERALAHALIAAAAELGVPHTDTTSGGGLGAAPAAAG